MKVIMSLEKLTIFHSVAFFKKIITKLNSPTTGISVIDKNNRKTSNKVS